MRRISIIEYNEVTVVELRPKYVRYEFDSFEEAIEALQNIEECEPMKNISAEY